MMARQRPSGLSSAVSSLMGLAIPLAVFLVTTPYLIARLGSAQYGILMLVISLTAIANSLDFGLAAGGVREIGGALARGETERITRLLREYLTLFALVALVIFFALVYFAPQIAALLAIDAVLDKGDDTRVVLLLAVSVLFYLLTVWASLLPRTMERYPAIAAIQVVSNLLTWVGAVFLLWKFPAAGVVVVVAWAAFVSAIVCLVLLTFSRMLLPAFSCRPAAILRETLGTFRYSLYASVGQVTGTFTYHADKVLIAYFLGPEPVAYYAVAANFASRLLSLGAAMANFVFPRAVALSAEADIAALKSLYLRASRYQLLVLVPLLAPLIAFAEPLLNLWLGPEFASQAAPLLKILCLAYLLAVLSVVPSQIFNGLGNARIGALFAGAATVINVGGCMVLLPVLGVVGAAIASLLGMLQTILYAGLLEARLGLGWFKSTRGFYFPLLCIAAAQFVVLYSAGFLVQGWSSLLFAGAAGYALFYLVWYGFGLLTPEDRQVMGQLSKLWQRKFWN